MTSRRWPSSAGCPGNRLVRTCSSPSHPLPHEVVDSKNLLLHFVSIRSICHNLNPPTFPPTAPLRCVSITLEGCVACCFAVRLLKCKTTFDLKLFFLAIFVTNVLAASPLIISRLIQIQAEIRSGWWAVIEEEESWQCLVIIPLMSESLGRIKMSEFIKNYRDNLLIIY